MKLIIEDEEGRKTVVPFVREEISIGRQEGNTIRLTERNVSRKHARLLRKNGSVLVEDLGSFNGVRVNGDRIEGKLPIQEGDLIEIGDYDLAIENEAADAAATPAPERVDGRARTEPAGSGHASATPVSGRAPTVPDPQLGEDDPGDEPARHQSTAVIRPEALAAQARDVRELAPDERPKIVVVSGGQAGQMVEIERSEFRIGRTSSDNDLAINHRSISRNHAKLVAADDGSWRVLDLQSANGVRVNNEDYADAPLNPGDLVELGHVKLRFVGPGESYKYVPEDERTPTPIARDSQRPGAQKPIGLYAGIGGGLLVLAAGGYFLFSGKPNPPPREARESHVSPPIVAAASPHPAAPAAAPKAMAPAAPAAAPEPEVPAPTPRVSRRQLLELVAQGKAALHSHDVGTAAEKLRAAQDLAPDDPAVARLERDIEAARKREAKRHEHKPAPAVAAAPAETGSEEAPAEAPAPRSDKRAKAMQGYQDAVGLMGGDDYAGAVGKLQKVLGLEPGMAEAHKALGICYAKLREFDKGAAHYEQYLKLKPNAADAPQVRKMLQDYYKTKGE